MMSNFSCLVKTKLFLFFPSLVQLLLDCCQAAYLSTKENALFMQPPVVFLELSNQPKISFGATKNRQFHGWTYKVIAVFHF